MIRIDARPLELRLYSPYGAIVEARASAPRSANHGNAQAWDALAILESARPAARCTASLFRCLAHQGPELPIRWLERHPFSTQMFVPMRVGRYLVVVAQGGDAPDLGTLAAFVVEGARAITYHPGIWHHPMVALDEDGDFVNVISGDGTERDCDEQAFEAPPAAVAIPER
ncbi:MAG: ureidoglycolate lyase [Sandaracinus sp.]